ncbi:MAG TPA: caspase family protein [Polyangia bacterium]|nr:caspase family protein [Polyangia bacterium]
MLPSRAHALRMALLIGNDEGQSGDVRLRYAESDASRLAALLTRVGGFGPDATAVVLGRTAGEVRQSLASVAARLRATPGEHLVVVYYSGHADAQGLHLGTSMFPLAELKTEIVALPAAVRILILDACQAGVLTRAKGGRPGLGFDVASAAGGPVQGLAILAATAGSELAQESDQLGGSVFTHHFGAGLSGLADRNHDGSVSLAEAFDYASERTVATTLATTTGPQHPTFRLDLSGRDELVLTRPGLRGVGYGHIRLDVAGWYFIRRRDGTIAAEVVSAGGETLALDPGAYEVTRRGKSGLDVAAVTVGEGQEMPISGVASVPVAFGRMVRKGGGPEVAYGLAAVTSLRTPLEQLGASYGIALAGRLDLSLVSFELRLGMGRAHQEAAHLSSTTWENSASAAALHVHDFGSARRRWLPTVGIGPEAGASYFAQQLDSGERRSTVSPFVGPTALAELTIRRRAFLRADVRLPVYMLRTADTTGESATRWRPALVVALGGGAWF